jgi:hypothetical protein
MNSPVCLPDDGTHDAFVTSRNHFLLLKVKIGVGLA